MRSERQVIEIVAAVVTNATGQALLVRKRGTTAFMLPGGKRALGEDDLDTLAREVREELGCDISSFEAEPLGCFRAMAANEACAIVEASLYRVSLRGEPLPQAEIEEILWLDPAAATALPLAPLAAFHVLPMIAAKQRGEPLPRPERVLFICKGNWFRSQMAAAIYNKLTGSSSASSAGTYTGSADEPEGQVLADLFPTPHFFEAMEKRGMHVRANMTRRLQPYMLDEYGVVVSMAEPPYIPSWLESHQTTIWWEVENPKVVDEAKAEEIYAQMHGLVSGLLQPP